MKNSHKYFSLFHNSNSTDISYIHIYIYIYMNTDREIDTYCFRLFLYNQMVFGPWIPNKFPDARVGFAVRIYIRTSSPKNHKSPQDSLSLNNFSWIIIIIIKKNECINIRINLLILNRKRGEKIWESLYCFTMYNYNDDTIA